MESYNQSKCKLSADKPSTVFINNFINVTFLQFTTVLIADQTVCFISFYPFLCTFTLSTYIKMQLSIIFTTQSELC